MADQEIGTCGICKKEDVALERTYYRYDIVCTCCNGAKDHHFEIVRHCHTCGPKPPRRVSVCIEPNLSLKR